MTKKILIVDFDLSSIERIQNMLDDEVFDVSTATSGELAWDMLTSSHFDLVVSEIVLPRLHGFQLSQAIAEQLPDCRCIIASGVFKGEVYRSQALYQFKADDYFEKPLDKIELKKRIAGLLDIPEEELSGIAEEVIEEVEQEVIQETVEEAVTQEAPQPEDMNPVEQVGQVEQEISEPVDEHEIIIEFTEHTEDLQENKDSEAPVEEVAIEEEVLVAPVLKKEEEPKIVEKIPSRPKKDLDLDAMLKIEKKEKPASGNYKKIDSEISRKIEDALSDLGIKV